MKKIFEGKTKNLYRLKNGNYLLEFKDDVTGKDGVFDPGANEVALKIEGIGKKDLSLSKYFFEKIIAGGFTCHYVSSNIEKGTMEVLPAKVFGKGIEIICRKRAVGSFIRRYGEYINEGSLLDNYVEITLKDDKREDPLITKEGLIKLGILKEEEYEILVNNTRKITNIISELLLEKGLELYDIKLEFGRLEKTGEIALIDEVSGGNMRVYKNGKYILPEELTKIILDLK